MSFITSIETAVPKYCHQQKDIASFFVNKTDDVTTQRKIKFVSDKSGINTRYSVVNDFSSNSGFTLFTSNNEIPSLSQRMAIYQAEALNLALEAVHNNKNFETLKSKITHVITVTCTGVFAPGLDIQLMQALHLSTSVARNSVNFMGCNAAILALKQADAICKAEKHAQVLIVCVELCTIHFQHNNNEDNILSNSLFGDGASALIVSSDKPSANNYPLLKINSFNSIIIEKGFNDMAWQLSSTGFLMNLTSYVSELINGNMNDFLRQISLSKNDIDYWAIHPGGKKIIDDFATTLSLDKHDLEASYEVLQRYGNMSSPTILFVLKQLIDKKNITSNKKIFVAAFGPGISLETVLLESI